MISSTTPAAWIRCPIIDLIELIATRGACSPNAALIALVSIESFSLVPVPWAEM